MSFNQDRTIPIGSLVVVTGANGFIGSHVVDQLLLSGYRVRGTCRNINKSKWTVDYFNTKYGGAKFELVEVPDMGASGAFNDVVKGASGFIHVATPVMQSADPNEAVPTVVNGILNTLNAAAVEPRLKRVVITSSSTAATGPKPNLEFSIDEKTWNHEDVEAAWKPPPYEGHDRVLAVYAASKMQSEEAAWKVSLFQPGRSAMSTEGRLRCNGRRSPISIPVQVLTKLQWMKENKPSFVLNAILPNANMGKVLSPRNQGTPSTVGWLRALWNGFEGHEDLKDNPPQYYVNVQDTARCHVGALLSTDVENERLFDFAYPYNWNDILAIYRKLYPEQKFMDDIPGLGRDLSKVSNERAEEMVRRFGRPGWTSLEESVADAVASWA